MTSRSEISASRPSPSDLCRCPLDILWLCREGSGTWCLGARGTCVMSIARSSGKSFSSLSLFLSSISCCCCCVHVFLRRETPSWSYYMPKLLCVCVLKAFSLSRLQFICLTAFRFSQCTVYALLVHQHVLYGILMLTLQATEPFFVSVCCCRCCFFVALWRLLCLLCWAARSLRIKYTQRLTCCLPVN